MVMNMLTILQEKEVGESKHDNLPDGKSPSVPRPPVTPCSLIGAGVADDYIQDPPMHDN